MTDEELADLVEPYLFELMIEGGHLKDRGYLKDGKIVRRPSPEAFTDAWESLMADIRTQREDDPSIDRRIAQILREEEERGSTH